MPCQIYALCDPRLPDVYRYVGASSNPAARLRTHRTNPGTRALAAWIASLEADKLEPTITVLQEVKHRDLAEEAERSTIQDLLAKGHPLLNVNLRKAVPLRTINVPQDTYLSFRAAVFEKHGKIRGALQKETALALLHHAKTIRNRPGARSR